MSGGGFRNSITHSEKRMIANIKEITGNHSDEEIYAMLKECSMDPDETIEKLLFQDPFHEVKSKRERRKENANSRESVDSWRKASAHGRGGKGGSLNISPRYPSHDATGGRNSFSGKENRVNQVVEKCGFNDITTKERSLVKRTSPVTDAGLTSSASENSAQINSSFIGLNNMEAKLPPFVGLNKPTSLSAKWDTQKQSQSDSGNFSVSMAPISSSVPYISSSDSVPVPSRDSQSLDVMNSIQCDVGMEQKTANPMGNAVTAEVPDNVNTMIDGNTTSKSQRTGAHQVTDFSQSSTSTHGESTIDRVSSNYNNLSQQIIGFQKVGFNEWKPKTKNSSGVQSDGTAGKVASPKVAAGSFEVIAQSQLASKVHDSEEMTNLQKNLEELHLPQSQLVILPDHIHVPESERIKLSFGSFGVDFELPTSYGNFPEWEKSSSLGIEETSDGQTSSHQNALEIAEEGDYRDHSQSPTNVPERFSVEGDISSIVIQEHNDLKQETELTAGSPQYSVVNASQNYSIGFAPPIGGSQLSPFENLDPQARDASQLPNFVVQPPFDPSRYYAQYYCTGADSDGQLSPFLSPGVATKYNRNVAVLPQSAQEGGVLSTAGPTALGTQTTGLMQSSVAVTQPSMAVFRPPTGMHISHFPPNYISYSHYFSPLYVPPPPIHHQLLGINAFPQQPQGRIMYPTPLQSAAAPVKYTIPQYKVGTNSGNSTHIGIPSGYGPYGSNPSGYNPNSAATGGNAITTEDISVSSFKENNAYVTGPPSEGSALWVAAPGREIPSLPTNSFYNLPPHGQHVTFTPTQTGHGTFASIYDPPQSAANVHPLMQQPQAVAGPVGNFQQQPQHSQTNWQINY